MISSRTSKRRNEKLTAEEEAELLKSAERLRKIGHERPFTEDEADAAVAIQRLLSDEEPVPLATVLREIDRDLDRRGRPTGSKRDSRVTRRRKA